MMKTDNLNKENNISVSGIPISVTCTISFHSESKVLKLMKVIYLIIKLKCCRPREKYCHAEMFNVLNAIS